MMIDTLRAKIKQGTMSVDTSTTRCDYWVEGGSNGIQTFFMTAEQLERLNEKSMKKFGRINFRKNVLEKWVKDHWEAADVDDVEEIEEVDYED